MMIWILAIIVTLTALIALYYAGGRDQVNASVDDADMATKEHYRAQLAEITADIEAGRLSEQQAEAARVELAREVLHLQSGSNGKSSSANKSATVFRLAAIALVGVLAFGIYSQIGSPQLPAQPLATREQPPTLNPQIDVADAVARVEAELKQNPQDVRGWAVLGPIYMRQGRFDDAAQAFRQVLALAPATADAETDLAEAVMMANNGSAEGEPLRLLQSAAARDPNHVRSRFYLAGEATRSENYENAISQWQALLALATGDEPWVAAARNGLNAAKAGLAGEPLPTAPSQSDPDQKAQIMAMVEGLADRLAEQGGSVEEWARLIRSYLVLNRTEDAQTAYDTARAAYPDAADRTDLDALAQQAGLELK